MAAEFLLLARAADAANLGMIKPVLLLFLESNATSSTGVVNVFLFTLDPTAFDCRETLALSFSSFSKLAIIKLRGALSGLFLSTMTLTFFIDGRNRKDEASPKKS